MIKSDVKYYPGKLISKQEDFKFDYKTNKPMVGDTIYYYPHIRTTFDCFLGLCIKGKEDSKVQLVSGTKIIIPKI